MPHAARTAIWIAAAALVVRLAVLIALPEPALNGDAEVYHRLATELLNGEGYRSWQGLPTAERPPLYAGFLAVLLWMGGGSLTIVYAAQAIIDALSCALIYLLGRRLLGHGPGVLAGVLAVSCVSLVAATRLVLTETLFTFLLLGAVWLLIESLERPRARVVAGCGAVLGLATLTRGTTMLLPAACAVPFVIAGGVRAGAKRWALLMTAFALVLLPWIARNWVVFHEVIPVATQGGKVLYSSYFPPDGKIFGRFATDETMTYAKTQLSETDASRYLVRQTVERLRAHPGQLPKLLAMKLGFFLVPFDWEVLGIGQGVWNATYAFILPFALLGMWVRRQAGEPSRWLWFVLGYFVAMSLLFYGSPRMRLPVEPYLLIWASAGLAWAADRFRDRLLQAGLAATAFLAINVGLMWSSQPVKRYLANTLTQAGLW